MRFKEQYMTITCVLWTSNWYCWSKCLLICYEDQSIFLKILHRLVFHTFLYTISEQSFNMLLFTRDLFLHFCKTQLAQWMWQQWHLCVHNISSCNMKGQCQNSNSVPHNRTEFIYILKTLYSNNVYMVWQ